MSEHAADKLLDPVCLLPYPLVSFGFFLMTSQYPSRVLLHSRRLLGSSNSFISRTHSTLTLCRPSFRSSPPYQTLHRQTTKFSIMTDKQEGHQHQSGDRTDRDIDEWKHREPYRVHRGDENGADGFEVKWEGQCHCGKVQYQLSRDKPLAAKYCHCTTCQRLHGVSLNPNITTLTLNRN